MARKAKASSSHRKSKGKAAPKRAKSIPLSAEQLRFAKLRFRELSGAAWKAGRAPAKLLYALANFRLLVPLPNPLIVTVVRARQGKGCNQEAEIAGFYDMTLAPGQACVGAAAVLQALNNAAAAECAAALECPDVCPCTYIPRQQLAIYRCQNGHEEGFLLQDAQVWNCKCLGVSG